MRNVFTITRTLVGEPKAVQIALAAVNKVDRRFELGERIASHAMEYILCVQTTYSLCSECCEPVTGDHYRRAAHDSCAKKAIQKHCQEKAEAKRAEYQAKVKEDGLVAQFMAELDVPRAQPQKQLEVAQTYDPADYDEENFFDEASD